MNIFMPRFGKPVAALGALAWTALTLGTAIMPTPAEAASGGAYYRAELTAPTTETSTITNGLLWKCAGTACAAGKGSSRPAVICARLVKQVGPVATFTAAGKALDAGDLARCNGK